MGKAPALRNRIICGDALPVLRTLPDECVHCAITSPPYWGLRSYLPKDHPDKPLELGSEKTPQEYVEKMVEVFREVRRILRSDGTFWLNMGDSYGGVGGQGAQNGGPIGPSAALGGVQRKPATVAGEKQLVGVPGLLKDALRADGWLHRSAVIWAKRSPMPESVNGWRFERHRIKTKPATTRKRDGVSGIKPAGDVAHANQSKWVHCPGCPKCQANDGYLLRKGAWRCTSSHEYLFQFAKSKMYYGDREAVKEDFADERMGNPGGGGQYSRDSGRNDAGALATGRWNEDGSISGRNPRDVWFLSSKPYKGLHFATFPPELAERCIKASTSQKGYCPECGEPWARIVRVSGGTTGESWHDHEDDSRRGQRTDTRMADAWESGEYRRDTLGWRATCNCGIKETTRAIVLDPFMGSGTTAQVALGLGRDYLGIELNEEYIGQCDKRLGLFAPQEAASG